MTPRPYTTLQRAICAYDFLALVPLALPVLSQMQLQTLTQIDMFLGGSAWPEFGPLQLMFVHLLGLIASGWTLWRWRNPSFEIGRFEGGLRLLVAAVFGYAFWQSGHPLLLVFGAVDVLLGAALLLGGWKKHSATPER